MSKSQLPEHPSLEYLRKLAKDRLCQLRAANPKAKLASAQLAIARNHGFTSWRALKAEVERRLAGAGARFFAACAQGDIDAVRGLLADHPDLVRATNAAAPHGGWTGLHSAAQHRHLNLVRLLLERGADPNAREAGDHTYPLHWAAAHRHVDVVRALLDAGGDVHGTGDDHELAAIGWATFFHKPGEEPGGSPEVATPNKIDDLYKLLKSRQIETAATGAADGIDFTEHINDTFYGARQFGIRDLNGYILYFIQPLKVQARKVAL